MSDKLANNFLDSESCELLAVAIKLAIAFSALLVEDKHLVTLHEWIKHFAYDLSTVYDRRTDLYATIVKEEYSVELDSVTLSYILNVVDK